MYVSIKQNIKFWLHYHGIYTDENLTWAEILYTAN